MKGPLRRNLYGRAVCGCYRGGNRNSSGDRGTAAGRDVCGGRVSSLHRPECSHPAQASSCSSGSATDEAFFFLPRSEQCGRQGRGRVVFHALKTVTCCRWQRHLHHADPSPHGFTTWDEGTFGRRGGAARVLDVSLHGRESARTRTRGGDEPTAAQRGLRRRAVIQLSRSPGPYNRIEVQERVLERLAHEQGCRLPRTLSPALERRRARSRAPPG